MIDLKTVLKIGDWLVNREGFEVVYYLQIETEETYEDIGRIDDYLFIEYLMKHSGHDLFSFMWDEEVEDGVVRSLNLEGYIESLKDDQIITDLYNAIKWLKS